MEILPLHSISLDGVVSVEQSTTSDRPSFTISSAKEKYNFSVKTDEVRMSWLNNLTLPNGENRLITCK